jgi:glucose/arabinose dehydrogenase
MAAATRISATGRSLIRNFILCGFLFGSSVQAQVQTDTVLPDISLPDGFSIELFTDEVPNARSLTLGEQQTVFVATRRDGRVYAVVPQENARPLVITIAEQLKSPNGIAFHEGDLYVAETSRIIRYRGIEEQLSDVPAYEVVYDSLPDESHHGWRYIAFGPDGKLYIAIGVPCNVCELEGYGEIIRMTKEGSEVETVAYGVRNSVGLTWDPDSGDLWFTDNGRDMMGDDVPPGELNHLTDVGAHFGFPYCHGGDVADPEFGQDGDCSEFEAPAQQLPAHVAPLGLIFYTGRMFPAEYQKQVFIAEHGSWNRSQKIGYRISIVEMENGQPQGYSVFAEGWLKDGKVSGRPADLLQLPDGSMLVSDDKAGSLFRIYYTSPMMDDLSAE